MFRLEELDEDKQKAAKCKGNAFVIGNPGTGKTKLIIARVWWLLKQGIKPEKILCMTFTIKASDELRERLIGALIEDFPNVSDVRVETFHSFALNAVKPYLMEKGIKINVLKEGMQRFLLYKVIKKLNIFDYGDNYLVETARQIAGKLSYLRAFKSVSQKDIDKIMLALRETFDEGKVHKNEDKIRAFIPHIPKILEEYEKEKRKYGIDYTDMLEHFRKYLEKNEMLFEHVIVDELQDSNELQAELVFELSKNGNWFVVGDRKQSIFRFQGASVNTFNSFKEDAETFVLSHNHRSTDEILSYAKEYLESRTGIYKDELDLLKGKKNGPKPRVISAEENTAVVVHLVRELLEKHGEVAVLAYTNYQLREIANALDQIGIQYSISGSNNATADYIKKSVIAIIDVLLNSNLASLTTALSSPFVNLSLNDIIKTKDYIIDNKIDDIESLRALEELNKFFVMYDEFRKEGASYKALGKFFDNYIMPVTISLGREQFLTANSLYTSMREFFEEGLIIEHNDFLDYLNISSDVYEMIVGRGESAVNLLTVHAAKGKEFKSVVYIPSKNRTSGIQFIEYAFDGIVLQEYNIQEDLKYESYKVDFVAFTRAKDELAVINIGEKYQIDGASEKIGTTELGKLEVIDIHGTEEMFSRYADILQLLQACKYKDAIDMIKKIKEGRPFQADWLIKHIDAKRKSKTRYSFSYISPFIKCPRQFMFGNLLELQKLEESTGAMDFGSEVHEALEQLAKENSQDASSIKEHDVKAAVENSFKCDTELSRRSGISSLDLVGVEKSVEVPLSQFLNKKCEGSICGLIDKIVAIGNITVIIDYKTNSTPNADPAQLHLYRYLYSINNSIPLNSIKTFFYYVYLRNNPINGAENPIEYQLKGVMDSQYEEKLERIRSAVDQIAFGDPQIFFEKNETKCARCPFSIMCRRLDWEMKTI